MAGNEDITINNRAVLNILQIIRALMSLAAETKLGALFINTKMTVSMQHTLEEMGHPQTCTPIQTNNSTAHALLTSKIMPKALKAMDMRLHWLHCREAQDQYHFYWKPGTQNLADYWTKYHPARHHKPFWSQILTSSMNTATKSFFKKILSTPAFVEQITAHQQTIEAKGDLWHNGIGVLN